MVFPGRVRLTLCLLTLPLSGLVAIVALLLREFVGLPGENLVAWAQVVSSDTYFVSQVLYIAAYVVPFFGFWALYMILGRLQRERLAFWGLMGALLGTGLPLTTLGVFTFASPELGRLYLQGHTNLPQVITDIALGSSMILGLSGAVLYVGGCILFCIAVWQCKTLPRWAGVGLALHSLLIAFGFAIPLLLVLGWVLLVLAGAWLASRIWREAESGR
jgi:hypothetical protein